MSTAILATKLFVPPPPAKIVVRPRLTASLDEGFHRRLTLVSAPAGFGKTTLVSDWVAGCGRPVAWLSLDEGDHDPARFLVHLVATLQSIAPKLGEGWLDGLRSSPSPPTESLLTLLVNDVATVGEPSVLVLDDYHVVDARAVDDMLVFLLEHLPPHLHIVIATREDPQLPLARLRARGQLTEVRAADLRFTASETARFLVEVMDLRLSAADVGRLETRTEGWIAGLQLAALSMRGREDVATFIQSFTGSHRFVLDYLVDEVLRHQPPRIRSFLLKTSILDRLSAPVCDAVTGRHDGREVLEALERGNFFVVPLDDERRLFRYHHLFADVLSAQLAVEQPELIPTLNARASAWYEGHGSAADAIRHALAAHDFGRAAGLIERAVPDGRRHRQESTVLRWLASLPDGIVRCRPVLCVAYAWASLACGEVEEVEARLRDAERWLGATADGRERPSEMVVVDEDEFRRLPASVALYRAGLAQVLGDVAATTTFAHRALELVPEDDHLERGAATGLLGLAYWTSGDLEAAHRTFEDGIARVRMAGFVSDAISGTRVLAEIRVAQGRLHDALSTYGRALQLAIEQGESLLRGTSDLYVGMSEVLRERNDLGGATRHLRTSSEWDERAGAAHGRSRWCVAMARVREAEGDLDGALELLDEAARLHVRGFFPDVRPVAALTARTWLAQGRSREASDWARERGLSVHDDLDYLHEFEHVTLARLLLFRYESEGDARSLQEAKEFLERLARAAAEGGRVGSLIEILVLQARAQRAHGDVALALAPLERALALAEPEGYVRTFLDEGAPIAESLRMLDRRGATGRTKRYLRGLLAAFGAQDEGRSVGLGPEASSGGSVPFVGARPFTEPLNERELEVLRLIAQGLSNREIGHRLFRAVSTIKGQNRIIFDKLRVRNRTEAVARARKAGLL